ncbi:hypothetical protein CHI02_19650 [Niallia circulans]|uniref:hypothetical protein n=1 Tax=Niallia circulans TaxID=1397 RepID=UPI000BA6855F|nr:hypothetical protein [Niallia circulans]PAE10502.1 hypothetical protein CHI02_19650 [Niallia circulans]
MRLILGVTADKKTRFGLTITVKEKTEKSTTSLDMTALSINKSHGNSKEAGDQINDSLGNDTARSTAAKIELIPPVALK